MNENDGKLNRNETKKKSIKLFHILTDDSIEIEVTNENENGENVKSMVPHFVNPTLYGHETVYETSARLLFMAVKWAKNLPR